MSTTINTPDRANGCGEDGWYTLDYSLATNSTSIMRSPKKPTNRLEITSSTTIMCLQKRIERFANSCRRRMQRMGSKSTMTSTAPESWLEPGQGYAGSGRYASTINWTRSLGAPKDLGVDGSCSRLNPQSKPCLSLRELGPTTLGGSRSTPSEHGWSPTSQTLLEPWPSSR